MKKNNTVSNVSKFSPFVFFLEEGEKHFFVENEA